MAITDTRSLALSARTPENSRATRRLRRTGLVPGVIYGGGEEPTHFAVDGRILRNTLAHAGAILEVSIDGGAGAPVLVKDVQRHPVRGEAMHVELLADEEGYDAVLVDSTTDSGIASVRRHLKALSLGPGEACWALASVLGEHFSILSMERKWEFFFIKGPKSVSLRHRLASVEDIGKAPDPVRLFEGKEELMNGLLIEAARRGIDQHRADVVIIGSTTMHQALPALSEALPVPVLSPGRVGVRTAEMLLDLGLRHSVGLAEGAEPDPRAMFEPATKKEAPLVHA